MTDHCIFGHAKTAILSQVGQGACCDDSAYYPLQKGHLYLDDSPLTHVNGVYVPLTDPKEAFCGFVTCETDARDWDEDCESKICIESRNLIPETIKWPKGWGPDEVKQVMYNKKCCFTFRATPDCCPPEQPELCPDEPTEEGAK